MQHMLHSLLEVVAFEVLTEPLSIPLSGGSPLLGGISTNLFLSRFVVTVPWHVENLSSQHKLLIISVSKAELFVHDTCRMWSHCKHVTCMTSSSPLMKGSSEIILIPTTYIMHGTIYRKKLLPRGLGSRSMITVPSLRYAFPFLMWLNYIPHISCVLKSSQARIKFLHKINIKKYLGMVWPIILHLYPAWVPSHP